MSVLVNFLCCFDLNLQDKRGADGGYGFYGFFKSSIKLATLVQGIKISEHSSSTEISRVLYPLQAEIKDTVRNKRTVRMVRSIA